MTEGFWWEIKHAVASCDPRKVVICLPTRNRREMYAYLREKASGVLPGAFPPDPGNAMFVAFRPSWEPILLAPRRFHLLRRLVVSRAPKMRDALNDVLSRLDVPSGEMPYTFAELIGLFGLIWFCGRLLCSLSGHLGLDAA
jgi:hypothetical protein